MSATTKLIRSQARSLRVTARDTWQRAEDLIEQATELNRTADAMDTRADELEDLDEVRGISGSVQVRVSAAPRVTQGWSGDGSQ